MKIQPNPAFYIPILAAILFAQTGCGGGGSSKSSVTVARSKAEIAYGEQVTVSWSSSGIDSLVSDETNFKVTSGQLTGSLTDMPAVDTVYTVVGNGPDGKTAGTVSVKVTKSAKKIALIADAATAGVPQIQEFLQGLTVQPVSVSASLPSLTGINVVVLLESANVGTAQQAAVKSFLDSGGSVVLVGRAANKLATGSLSNENVSSIGSWFAGATQSHYVGTGGFAGYTFVPSRPSGFPLSAVVFDDWIPFNAGTHCSPITAQAKKLDTDPSAQIAFAYKPVSGGKVGFAGAAPTTSTEAAKTMRTVFLSIVRWSADGS